MIDPCRGLLHRAQASATVLADRAARAEAASKVFLLLGHAAAREHCAGRGWAVKALTLEEGPEGLRLVHDRSLRVAA